ncbi:MAG: hypothetical protein EBS05_27545, partial [Proteobacteria bacterium]|nr:hypothetical protein [Pseudomonadota bacterium]
MTVARGTTYGLHEAWERFGSWWDDVWGELLGALAFFAVVYSIARSVKKNGIKGVAVAAGILFLCAIMVGMLLPALAKAKAKSPRIKSANNLKQIGLAAMVFANDNADRFPDNFEEMMNELGSDKILTDPQSGERYVWVGAGKPEHGDAILAYSPTDNGGRNVVFGDGHVEQLSSSGFTLAQQKDAQIVAQSAVRQAQGVGMRKDAQALNGRVVIGGMFTSADGVVRGRAVDGPSGNLEGSFKPQSRTTLPAAKNKTISGRESGEMLAQQLEQADKLKEEAKSETPIRKQMGNRVVEVSKKWNEGTRNPTEAQKALAASEPVPISPPALPLVATPVPTGQFLAGASIPDGTPTDAGGVTVFGNNRTAIGNDRAKDQNGAFQLGTIAAGGFPGSGGRGDPANGLANSAGEAAQTAVGMRSIRIDIPRSGQAFT